MLSRIKTLLSFCVLVIGSYSIGVTKNLHQRRTFPTPPDVIIDDSDFVQSVQDVIP